MENQNKLLEKLIVNIRQSIHASIKEKENRYATISDVRQTLINTFANVKEKCRASQDF